jgi:hypothetical protein
MMHQILALACANAQPTTATLSKIDLRWFMVVAWCIHPDLIPHENVVYITELVPPLDHGPLLAFL